MGNSAEPAPRLARHPARPNCPSGLELESEGD